MTGDFQGGVMESTKPIGGGDPLHVRLARMTQQQDGTWEEPSSEPAPVTDAEVLEQEYDAVGLVNGQRTVAGLLRHIRNNHAATLGAVQSTLKYVKAERQRAQERIVALEEGLAEILRGETDIHYPYVRWCNACEDYRDVTFKSGTECHYEEKRLHANFDEEKRFREARTLLPQEVPDGQPGNE